MVKMLSLLDRIERELPDLLALDGWQSLDVDYHPPRVERVWRQHDDNRIFLHRVHSCEIKQALFHPHPWPSIVKVFGTYVMNIGYGEGEKEPPVASTVILAPGSVYEMSDINGWHSVAPSDAISYSLMITGK